jgi:hypothetical protein
MRSGVRERAEVQAKPIRAAVPTLLGIASIAALTTYAVILLANGIAAAQRIAITQNPSPPSDA